MSIVLQWFLSSTVRHATDLRKHVQNLVAAQRDLLPPEGIKAIEEACAKVSRAIAAKVEKSALQAEMTQLETVANKWLRPYPHASWRENIEVFLVAIAVAMSIRTFFLQPFKIPTGSMQPTLYGTTFEDFSRRPEVPFPSFFGRFIDGTLGGTFYHVIQAEADGVVKEVGPRRSLLKLVNTQTIVMLYQDGPRQYEKSYQIYFSPQDGHNGDLQRGIRGVANSPFADGFGLIPGMQFRKGDYVLRLKDMLGDHLFVDRLAYNFRRPERGEIIVFETKGINGLPQDQFYIKRLVALGGERVALGDDRHLRINGQRLDASTTRFEHVYHLNGPPRDSEFSGHVNETVANQHQKGGLAPLFPNGKQEFSVRPKHYMVMGDNTMNSLDSRAWGDFSEASVIGKSAFVYWPFLSQGQRPGRFGWSHR